MWGRPIWCLGDGPSGYRHLVAERPVGVSVNTIHPRATVIGDVRMGTGNLVDAGAVLVGPMTVGDDNYFGPNCVVGSPPEDELLASWLRRAGTAAELEGRTVIGSRNTIRELVTVNRGTLRDTVIGDDCYVMARGHVPHDAVLGDRVKMATNAHLGGYTWVGDDVYIGLMAVLHQFTVVGAVAMIGMGSVVTVREIPPGSTVYGNPARLIRPNSIGLERIGIRDDSWWLAMSNGEDVSPPPEIAAGVADFRRAVESSRAMRAMATEWRRSRREDTDGDH